MQKLSKMLSSVRIVERNKGMALQSQRKLRRLHSHMINPSTNQKEILTQIKNSKMQVNQAKAKEIQKGNCG